MVVNAPWILKIDDDFAIVSLCKTQASRDFTAR